MTPEELDIIKTEAFHEKVKANKNISPIKIALNTSVPYSSLLATQVKYLQRAKKKLPTFYENETIFTQKLFEQSSSEQSAAMKKYSGQLCVDLTCGLGVDSYFFSKRFNKVIAIEQDPVNAAIARINFKRLSANNIEVICDTAENFMQNGIKADLIYVDPDRRTVNNQKVYALEDCTPNILELLETTKRKCNKLVIKTSPLFDVEEAFRLFGKNTRINVISVEGECKEVLIEVDKSFETPIISVSSSEYGYYEAPYKHIKIRCKVSPDISAKYLLLPDVALRKAHLGNRYLNTIGATYFENDSIGLINNLPDNFMGKTFEIKDFMEYKPKILKNILKTPVEIMKINFPLSTSEISKSLKIREGNGDKYMFCKLDGKLWVIAIKNINL